MVTVRLSTLIFKISKKLEWAKKREERDRNRQLREVQRLASKAAKLREKEEKEQRKMQREIERKEREEAKKKEQEERERTFSKLTSCRLRIYEIT